MNKKNTIILVIVLAIVIIGRNYSSKSHNLRGFYQKEVSGYHIQMLFQEADNNFIEWIDNRPVDKGTYEKIDDNLYRISGELQNLEIELRKDNSFELIISKLNNGEPILMENITPKDHSVSFGEWNDVEEYRSLIDKD